MNLFRSLFWLGSLVGVCSYMNGVDTWVNPGHGSWSTSATSATAFPVRFNTLSGVAAISYVPNTNYSIVVGGGTTNFRGFILDSTSGVFHLDSTDTGVRYMTGWSGVTHVTNTATRQHKAIWTSPPAGNGPVVFRTIVVVNANTGGNYISNLTITENTGIPSIAPSLSTTPSIRPTHSTSNTVSTSPISSDSITSSLSNTISTTPISSSSITSSSSNTATTSPTPSSSITSSSSNTVTTSPVLSNSITSSSSNTISTTPISSSSITSSSSNTVTTSRVPSNSNTPSSSPSSIQILNPSQSNTITSSTSESNTVSTSTTKSSSTTPQPSGSNTITPASSRTSSPSPSNGGQNQLIITTNSSSQTNSGYVGIGLAIGVIATIIVIGAFYVVHKHNKKRNVHHSSRKIIFVNHQEEYLSQNPLMLRQSSNRSFEKTRAEFQPIHAR